MGIEQANRGYEIIDAHTHIFPAKVSRKATDAIGEFYDFHMARNGSVEELLEDMAEGGISLSLVCSSATVPKQTRAINDFISAACKDEPRFFGFGTMHPSMPEEEIRAEIVRMKELGLHGVKLHPDFQKFDLDCPEAMTMFSCLEEGGMPVLVHTGDDRYTYSRPKRISCRDW